jgi:hypothetical protein
MPHTSRPSGKKPERANLTKEETYYEKYYAVERRKHCEGRCHAGLSTVFDVNKPEANKQI